LQLQAQTLVVPPSPGDLSNVMHLKQSDDYTVEVKKSNEKEKLSMKIGGFHEKERKEACQDYKRYIICPKCLSKILKTGSYYHINSKICMKRKLT
jgi:hypothetical protein